jgi:calcineurin-like phosphoesterase family protein
MSKVFLYSDPHFGHAGVCRFLCDDGVTKIRPWDDPAEMDEALVERYNTKVGKNDKCYFLGDVVINRRCLPTLARLNGDKVLIRGNHDIFRDDEYRQYFRELRAYHVMNGMILSHIPLHPESLGRFGTNIHGHTHQRRVMDNGIIDVRYHCVCVEQTDFAPILFEDVIKKIESEGGQIGFQNGNGPTM